MKKKNSRTVSQRVGHFFKHYFALLMIALCCAILTVILVAYCATPIM